MGIRLGKIGTAFVRHTIRGIPGGAYAMHKYDQRRKQNDRRKSRIEEAYQDALARLETRQGDIRQSHEESLVARGLATGGANTIGGQQRTDLEGEFGLEHKELGTRRRNALEDSKYQFQGDVESDAVRYVNTAASVATMGMGGAAPVAAAMSRGAPTLNGPASSATWTGPEVSPVQSAMMRGADHPDSWFGGISGLDPLNAPGSSWNRPGMVVGRGQDNIDFNVVGG